MAGSHFTGPVYSQKGFYGPTYTYATLPAASSVNPGTSYWTTDQGWYTSNGVSWVAAVCNGISVKLYGAKGDGITDDTAAIQNCITQNPNRKIFFPKGKYRITNTITINPLYGYVLEGEGYDPCSPQYASTPDFTNIWIDNTTFVDAFSIVWDYSTYPYPPFREILFRNLTISGTPCTYAHNVGSGHGVYTDYVVLRMENVCIANHGKSGLYLSQGFSSVFTACLFNYNTENGVYMPGNNNQVEFTGCQFLGNSRVDNFTDPNGDYVGAAGCMLDGLAGENITVTFTSCEFSINGINSRFGETTQVPGAHGIYARSTTGLSLIGCYAEYNYGAYAQADYGSGWMYLSDNINIDNSCIGAFITGLFTQMSDINIINPVGLIYENGRNLDTAFTIKTDPASPAVSRPPIIRISADTSSQSFFRIYGNSWGTNTTTTLTNSKQVDQFYSAIDPTGTGTHKVGDICWSTGTLTGSNPIGWICTTAPNTFKAFGGASGSIYTTASSQNSTSATLANITGLTATLAANTTYRVDCFVTFQSAATTTGINFGFTSPTGTTCMLEVVVPITNTADASQLRTIFPNNSSTNAGSVLGTGVSTINSNHTARFSGIIKVGGTGGTFAAQYATEVAASSITIPAGSTMVIQQIS